jgi:hypothetical protein
MHLLKCLFVALWALSASIAWADRNLPMDAPHADLAPLEYPYLKIAGKNAKLAPGAIIVNQKNCGILPLNLPSRASALYKLDLSGEVISLWLSEEENRRVQGERDIA